MVRNKGHQMEPNQQHCNYVAHAVTCDLDGPFKAVTTLHFCIV